MQCSFGMTPAPLSVIDSTRPKLSSSLPVANIMDYVPMTNIPSFGMCQSMANPQVAAATSAALGVLTPQPCIPVVTAPWSPGGQLKVANFPVLMDNGKCMCNWAGQISFTFPGNALPNTEAK